MNYGQKLEDLLAFTQMGAMSGPDALEGLYALQEERKAERDARRAAAMEAQQAQQDSLLGLASMAYSSASEGDPLSMLIQNPEFVSGAAQLGMRPRQVAKQTGYYGPGGVSSLNPALDPADQAAILEDFYAAIQSNPDLESARRTVQNKASQAYDSTTYNILRPEIDKLINDAFAGATKRY